MARRNKSGSKFRDRVRANTSAQKAAGSAYGYLNLPQGVHIYTPKPGSRARLDILPYIVTDQLHPDRDDEMGIAVIDEMWYKRPFRTHRNIGADNATIICLGSIGKACPICEYKASRMKEGADKDETDALKFSLRNLYPVVPIGDREYDEVPHVWDMSQFLFQNLLNDELEEDERYADFPDPDEGWTLKIRFDEGRIGNSRPFAEASRIDFEERDRPYREKELKKVPALDDMLNILTYQKLERVFLGVDDDDDKDEDCPRRHDRDDDDKDDDKDPPRRGRSRSKDDDDDPPRRSRRSRDDDDDKDDDPPRRSRRSRDDDDDKDDDPPPRRSRSRDDDDNDDKDEDRPQRTTRRRDDDDKDDDKNECPSGYRFGKDTDDYDECDDCPIW